MRLKTLIVFMGMALVITVCYLSNGVESRKIIEKDSSAQTVLADVYEIDADGTEVHHGKRSKRTIGHIFSMFRGFMGNMFGGGKGKGGKKGKKPYTAMWLFNRLSACSNMWQLKADEAVF